MESKVKEKKDEYVGCWEYWRCSEEAKADCPVYENKDGKRCWIYAHNLTPLIWGLSPSAIIKEERKFKNCKECGWYKRMHAESDD